MKPLRNKNSEQKMNFTLVLSMSFLCILASLLIVGYRHRDSIEKFAANVFERVALFPAPEKEDNIEFSTSGVKSLLHDTLEKLHGKCAINHPATGKPVMSRYGSDCTDRNQRFPSVDDRLKVYLSSWYLPPCSKDDLSAIRFTNSYKKMTKTHRNKDINATFVNFFNMETPDDIWSISNVVIADRLFFVDEHNVMEFIQANSTYMRHYVNDVVDSIIPAMTRVGWNYHLKNNPSLIIQFGDAAFSQDDKRHNVNIPRIQKFRHTIAPNDLDGVIGGNRKCMKHARVLPNTTKTPLTLPAIIWKLNSERHYGHIVEVDSVDGMPYRERKNMALFRGGLTGKTHWDEKAKDEENCSVNQRCSLVMQYFYSPLVDAKVTEPFFPQHPEKLGVHDKKYKEHWAPDRMNETLLDYRSVERMTIEDMLTYKILIILEGNDVSSGLKWALYSHSVVMMTHPTLETSWAMEELLEPYVHFVPIKHDLSDLESSIQWVLDHEEEAQIIALRGRLWIQDLVFDDNIQQEDNHIQDEILNRYRDNFFKS